MNLYRALAGLLLVGLAGSAQAWGQAAAAEEAPPEVEGIEIARPDGRFLGVTMDGLHLRLTFYDKEKKPAAVDVARATARWRPPGVSEMERAVLNPAGDGFSLVGNRIVRKPWVYVVYLALVDQAGEVVESYQVRLSDEVVPVPES